MFRAIPESTHRPTFRAVSVNWCNGRTGCVWHGDEARRTSGRSLDRSVPCRYRDQRKAVPLSQRSPSARACAVGTGGHHTARPLSSTRGSLESGIESCTASPPAGRRDAGSRRPGAALSNSWTFEVGLPGTPIPPKLAPVMRAPLTSQNCIGLPCRSQMPRGLGSARIEGHLLWSLRARLAGWPFPQKPNTLAAIRIPRSTSPLAARV